MFFNKTALCLAVENKHTEIVQLLMSHPRINVNIKWISKLVFYEISNQLFLLYFKNNSFFHGIPN